MEIIYFGSGYFFVVFILSRLVIPHFGFKETPLPEQIPASMAGKINEIKGQANSAQNFLNLAYDYLGSRYRSERLNTIFKLHYSFKPLEEIWQMQGYLPCTVSSFLLKIFLVRSGWFKETDIRRRHVFMNFVIHQYLQVKLGSKWLDVDVGEKYWGMSLGQHAEWFG